MTMPQPFQLVIVAGAFACMTAFPLAAQSDAPVFVKRSFVGSGFFLGFTPSTAEWISLESSSDLSTWSPVASISSTNSVTEFVEENARNISRRFYRLRQPGVTTADAEAVWSQEMPGAYRFELEHVRSHVRPYVLTATLTVVGGQKALSNIQADGEPVEQVDPAEFPTIEELFAALRQAQLSGCWRVAATYETTKRYPTWCAIERLAESFPGKTIDLFRITGVTSLANANGNFSEMIAPLAKLLDWSLIQAVTLRALRLDKPAAELQRPVKPSHGNSTL